MYLLRTEANWPLGRASVEEPPLFLGQGMLNWLSQDRLVVFNQVTIIRKGGVVKVKN